MRAFLQLMALLTALAAGLTFLVGVLNKLFDWNLGLGIGGFDIELPQDFFGTVAVAVALLIAAGFFELAGNFKGVMARVKAHPVVFAIATLLLVGTVAGGLYNLAGGPLGLAVENGDVGKVRTLLAEADYPASDLGDHLYQSLKREDLQMAELLLKGGADPNRVSGEFQTPLLTSACLFFPKRSVFWLLDQGADPNLQDNLGRTPAFNLLQYRSSHFPQESDADLVEILDRLRTAGADFDIKADDGRSAKTLAAEKNSERLNTFFEQGG